MSKEAKGIEFYVPMSFEITVKNPEVIPLLIQMRWYRQATSSGVHLRLRHPRYSDSRDNFVESFYHKVLLDNVNDSEQFSHPIARLRLEGGTRWVSECEKLCALLEVDLTNPKFGKIITFSPVPFGLNGKPVLPYTGEMLDKFLLAVRLVLSNSQSWTADTLVAAISGLPLTVILKSSSPYHVFMRDLINLDIVSSFNDKKGPNGGMTPVMFEEIFGVKLPDTGVEKSSSLQVAGQQFMKDAQRM